MVMDQIVKDSRVSNDAIVSCCLIGFIILMFLPLANTYYVVGMSNAFVRSSR